MAVSSTVPAHSNSDHIKHLASIALKPDLSAMSTTLLVVILTFSFFSSWLSLPLVSARTTTVTHLPGFDGPLPFSLETGYVDVDVDGGNGEQMFYYFIRSEKKPAEDPLLVWHSGGPMCSALSGLALEIGPLRIDVTAFNEGRPYLVYNEYTWTKMSNIIFVDAPIGTGFSYSNNALGFRLTDTKSVRQLSSFTEKWLVGHPEFLTNSLYFGGDSYAGKVVPMVAQDVADGNQAGNRIPLNLKGYLIGNAPTTDGFITNLHIKYAHGMGILSDELYEAVGKKCGLINEDSPTDVRCLTSFAPLWECLIHLNWPHILEPQCLYYSTALSHTNGMDRARSMEEQVGQLASINSSLPTHCRALAYHALQEWANVAAVREALNIRKGTVGKWKRCLALRLFIYDSDIQSSVMYQRNVTSRGYRALVYSGDHDFLVPYVHTYAWIKSLNFPIVDQWRPWFVNGQVGGYTQAYSNNLTFATVKGAGHAAPAYQPKESQAMFGRWISNAAL